MRRRERRPDLEVGSGERLLAWATTADGAAVGGSRDALYLPARLAWEEIEAVEWDTDTSELRVSEVGVWGEPRREHRLEIQDPGRLLELIRERVTASVVLQRHVAIDARRGLRVIARRAPGKASQVTWVYEYDEGIDPHDLAVRLAAAEALAAARGEMGPDAGPADHR